MLTSSKYFPIQLVCILMFSSWSCSAGPSLFADDLRLYTYQKFNPKSTAFRHFSSYVSLLFPLGLSHADQACSLMICISGCTHMCPKSLHFDASVCTYPLAFVLGLAQQDRPYLLMICVCTCTKIQPEIDGFSSLQRVRIPSFFPWSFSTMTTVLTDTCISAYLWNCY